MIPETRIPTPLTVTTIANLAGEAAVASTFPAPLSPTRYAMNYVLVYTIPLLPAVPLAIILLHRKRLERIGLTWLTFILAFMCLFLEMYLPWVSAHFWVPASNLRDVGTRGMLLDGLTSLIVVFVVIYAESRG